MGFVTLIMPVLSLYFYTKVKWRSQPPLMRKGFPKGFLNV